MKKTFLSIWLFSSLLLLLLQTYGGLLPANQDSYFYMGYFATTILVGFSIALVAHLASKYLQKRQ